MEGYFDCSGSLGFSVRVHYETQPGRLTVTGIQVRSSIYYANVYYLTAKVTAGGAVLLDCDSYYGSHNVYIHKTGVWTDIAGDDLPPWTVEGLGSVTVKISFSGATAGGQSGHGWKVTGSRAVTLPEEEVPVAVSAPASGVLGETVTLSLPGAGRSKTVSWQLGEASGTLGTTTAEVMAWTLPDSLAQHMAGAEAQLIFTCLSSGESTAAMTLQVPRRAPFLPVLTAELTPEGTELGIYIRGIASVRGTLSAVSTYSTVTALSMQVEGIRYPGGSPLSAPLAFSGEIPVVCRAEDSRGFVTEETFVITCHSYEAPRPVPYAGENAIFCSRCDGQGNAGPVGTGILLRTGLKFHALEGRNTASLACRVKPADGSWGDWIPLLSGEGSIEKVLPGAAPSLLSSYQLQLRAQDSLGSLRELTLILPTAAAAFHLKKGGQGAAFGKFAEADRVLDIAPDWNLCLKGSILADHIREQGRNEHWHWQVYASGFALCFGRIRGTAAYPVAFLEAPAFLSGGSVTSTRTECSAEEAAAVIAWGFT